MIVPPAVHVAGPPQHDGLYQECSRCHRVLLDDRDIADSRHQQPGGTYASWLEGEHVAIDWLGAWTAAADKLPYDLCQETT